MSEAIEGLLLTRGWRDNAGRLELVFWAASDAGPVRIVVNDQRAVCFLARDGADGVPLPAGTTRREVDLRDPGGRGVDALYFPTQRALLDARDALRARGLRPLETDLKPADRYLMERFVTAGFEASGSVRERDGYLELRNPRLRPTEYRRALKTLSLDIETDGLDGPLFSIGLHAEGERPRVFLVGADEVDWPAALPDVDVEHGADEVDTLMRAFAAVRAFDPDALIGWNVVGFDLDYLATRAKKLGVPFDLGRGGERATVLRPDSPQGVHVARLPGRVVLDGIDVLKAAFYSFENFELETVARALLGEGKVKVAPAGADRVEAIRRMYADDRAALVRYNAADCVLVSEIFAHAKLLDFSLRRAELTGLQADRLGGSVAAFDFLYLPRLHRAGHVALDALDVPEGGTSPGGYVLDSKPGLYDAVLLLDFKSLYPSIIRTFKVDPLALRLADLGEHGDGAPPVPGFEGAAFVADEALLPSLIERLWAVRDGAKRAQDAPLSQAVKILMNSFYGVLGANGCRFRDHRLTSSITRRGHEIIRDSHAFIEEKGFEVIYGDTDSLFVRLADGTSEADAMAAGKHLSTDLNAHWRTHLEQRLGLESHLEIEFETLFLRFLMPTVRGDSVGSKKRYAGLTRAKDGSLDIVFKGLESVRTDWTPLARRFQRELFRRVFMHEPVEDYVRETNAALLAGELDAECVYSKRLRRGTTEYVKNVPPHVQAARLLDAPVRQIDYVITLAGPQPVRPGEAPPTPDYAHYRERQLAPAADTILQPLGLGFESLTDAQIALF